MSRQERYFIGPNLLTDIRRVVGRVDGIAYNESGPVQGVAHQSLHQPDSSSRLRIGKTTATWNKGTLATITLWETGTPPNETQGGGAIENVVNKWATVASGKWVGIQLAKNGSYYLVVSEC
jgi:hypothetical protein